jgi:alkylation response protein AidB-like acyl-CoA dehydrogenase
MEAFAREKIAPHAARMDREGEFAPEVHRALADLGLWGAIIPKAYGGLELDTTSYAILIEEIARVCGSTCLMVAAHCSLGCYPIIAFGNDAQKQRYLPRAAKGELIAFALTEPGAGSDAGATKTKAEKQADGSWTVNGTKCWCTNATRAFAHVITARIDDTPGVKSISSFILERGMKGFATGKKEDKMGLRGSDTAFLHFDDVRITDVQRLGEVGEGFKQFMITLDGGRISIGAMGVGLAQGALDVALKYAAEHKDGASPIVAHQAIQFKLADMETQATAARLLVLTAAAMKDAGKPFSKYSAMAKLFASEAGRFCTYQGLQILGADGLGKTYPIERQYRDVKLCEIGEGTSEIQRLVISRELLKELAAR